MDSLRDFSHFSASQIAGALVIVTIAAVCFLRWIDIGAEGD